VQPEFSKTEADTQVDRGPGPGAITERLARLRPGQPEVWNDLLTLVYGDLHRLARGYMRDQVSGATLQPTALVNETYLRLLRQTAVEWKGRAHFFGVAALVMRRILVDEARRRALTVRVMEQVGRTSGPAEPAIDLCLLDAALTRLAQLDARQADVVELRYFGGLTIEETASFLGVSPKTVKRDWEMARAWLRAELRGSAT
jgi:RNA polymerase sigma factor (TIGR02999 family)